MLGKSSSKFVVLLQSVTQKCALLNVIYTGIRFTGALQWKFTLKGAPSERGKV
ncbi:protein of unknown function [Thermococcus nautili]|nr:protein of unknown function [Thermococcus nautili]